MKTNSGFDFLAPVYDSLARLVFGKSIKRAQEYFLNQISPKSKILILGGGSGWILKEIVKHEPSSMMWYVELSRKMIEKARQQHVTCSVHFIHGKEQDIPPTEKFDVVITNFYLDLFPDKRLEEVIQHINQHVHQSTIWLVTDFVEKKWWHSWMLKIMYIFFKVVCGIEASNLPAWSNAMQKQGWTKRKDKSSYYGFIESTAWVNSGEKN